MAGNSRPKASPLLGHGRSRQAPGNADSLAWEMPPGVWRAETVEWWEHVTSSMASRSLWADEDLPKVRRLLWMVDRWWTLTEESPGEAMRTADTVRRAEAELYLGPAERLRAGLSPAQSTPAAAPVESSARARLRSA